MESLHRNKHLHQQLFWANTNLCFYYFTNDNSKARFRPKIFVLPNIKHHHRSTYRCRSHNLTSSARRNPRLVSRRVRRCQRNRRRSISLTYPPPLITSMFSPLSIVVDSIGSKSFRCRSIIP
ncbi:hypothetical protein MtrunA17_Chr3g0140621 [Medicago truncatula]|uniref:Uncharacterized protein n=1 Tax=Medicago truncatula TaxID=3880 RepID=A0A072VD48_MEDTR|nr:hypothetical protein MTR_3g110400 [Medicago truncatula]RHN70912.1 hypothetical protein MtrunA17_Chr3g0140621 [Medicago truncatula]